MRLFKILKGATSLLQNPTVLGMPKSYELTKNLCTEVMPEALPHEGFNVHQNGLSYQVTRPLCMDHGSFKKVFMT